MFDYEGGDKPRVSQKPVYETNFFNTMINSVISNMDSRFMSLKQHFENFGFLYDLKKFKNIPKEPIQKNCRDFLQVVVGITTGKCPEVNLSGDGPMLGLPDVAQNSSR
ncbi:hypothetical protein TNCV_3653271 [Trichonephila clavipes]|nr:hypothetical protein TNCV_3653271 [Trichonephila clavipes]